MHVKFLTTEIETAVSVMGACQEEFFDIETPDGVVLALCNRLAIASRSHDVESLVPVADAQWIYAGLMLCLRHAGELSAALQRDVEFAVDYIHERIVMAREAYAKLMDG